MAGLTSELALAYFRYVLSDNNSGADGRWSDNALYFFLDRANKRVVGDVFFPDSRVTVTTVEDQQIYQFPLLLKTYAIYVGGQLVVPSDLATLEGRQINYWDPGLANATVPPGNDFAPGTTGPQAPQWTIQTPISYPTANGTRAFPAPDAEPWDSSGDMRPRFYWRGGYCGFVPAPGNASPVTTISVDCVRQPDPITGTGQALTTPDNFLDAIVFSAAELAYSADDGNRSAAQSEKYGGFYTREKRKLLMWRGDYQGEQRDGPKVNTLRPAYSSYRKRTSGGFGC